MFDIPVTEIFFYVTDKFFAQAGTTAGWDDSDLQNRSKARKLAEWKFRRVDCPERKADNTAPFFYEASADLLMNHHFKQEADERVHFRLGCIFILSFTIVRIRQFVKRVILTFTNFQIRHPEPPPSKSLFLL